MAQYDHVAVCNAAGVLYRCNENDRKITIDLVLIFGPSPLDPQ